jgi:DNA-binding SARP family transcriptional activator
MRVVVEESAQTGRLAFRLVGTFGVLRDGQVLADADIGSRKARQLLKLLVVERGRTIPTDRIAELLWADRPPRQPADNVATLVSRLRAALGGSVVTGTRSGYRLGGPAAAVDLDDAAHWVATAESRLAAGQPGLALAAAQRALADLADGTVLGEEPTAEWAGPARAEAAGLLRRARHGSASAALAVGDPAAARRQVELAIGADPLDEPAHRLLMLAHQQGGEPARALDAYARLRSLLADELGADPAPASRELHLAILREQTDEPSGSAGPTDADWPTSAGGPAGAGWPTGARGLAGAGGLAGADGLVPADTGPPLVGRAAESRQLADAWSAAAAGRPGVLLVTGVAGIGKTRLASETCRLAEATGAQVLSARCYHTERSLFLQPLVEAVRLPAGRLAPATLRELAGEWAAPLVGLIPELAGVLGDRPAESGAPEIQRRRAFEALAAFLRRLAEPAPVLLLLDDLQNAGLATIEFLHYLARHLGGSRLLVLATVRSEEGGDAQALLAGVASRLELGPLEPAAVAELAGAAGRGDLADRIHRLTRGHPLFVVETLRGLVAGESGVPGSLQAAVAARLRLLGADAEEALRAAAVLGPPFDPPTLAATLGIGPVEAARRCEQALQAGLVVVAGRAYEFANDLVQEVLYTSTPEPTRVAYHLRAADLFADRPEALAAHAAAAGDWLRAGRGRLVAAESALRQYAFTDAERLLGQAMDAAGRVAATELLARAYLVRGRVREVLAAYDGSWADHCRAAELARETGDRRLEMMALRELGGDVLVARGRSIVDCGPYLETGIRLARELGDRAVEADLLARVAVLSANRLRFELAGEQGRQAVAAARAARDDGALACALDGLKTAYAYVGDLAGLRPVLAELEPLLRRRGDLWRLQWTVFESALPALAAGDWDAAVSAVDSAVAVNRRSGYLAYRPWFVAHLGWIERLRGRLDEALRHGRQAVADGVSGGHPWWSATAHGFLGSTLLADGDPVGAAAVLAAGLAETERNGAEAYRLRCLGPLAEATGRPADVLRADAMLSRITAPAGQAWLLGSDAYLSVARAWLALDEPARGLAALAPLLGATRSGGWAGPLAEGLLVAGRCEAAQGEPEEAGRLLAQARELAIRHGMPLVAQAAGTPTG